MLRRRVVSCVLGALALGLAACSKAEDPPPAEAEAPAPAASAEQTPDAAFCEEVGRRISEADCQDLTQLADNAQAGAAAFNAPDPMRRGEAHTLQLAISYALTPAQVAAREEALAAQARARDAAELAARRRAEQERMQQAPPPGPPEPPPPTPGEVVDPLQGETVEFTPLVGRFMRAELVGTGFEITPLSPASQEVQRDSVTTWNWRVVAQEGGRRTLTLRTVVEGCTGEGQCYPLRSTSQNYDVSVEVGLMGQVRDFLAATPNWLRLIAGVLAALAALVGAWFALRNAFRKGRAS